MVRDLAPILGRRLSFAVVPNWHAVWPLAAHPDYCQLVREFSEELLLHGYFHRRLRGRGATSLLVDGSDEMNGFDADDTRRALHLGQRAFTDAFGEPARGFLAPAWQRGHVKLSDAKGAGLQYVLGFFSVETAGQKLPLATWTWDCGRLGWLGHIGHALGPAFRSIGGGTPSLAIHPRDLERGYWPKILRLIRDLLEAGYEPTTIARLLDRQSPEDSSDPTTPLANRGLIAPRARERTSLS